LEKSCEHCATSPDGIEGHLLLALHAEKPRKATFVCNGCGSRWIRVYEGSGHFKWERAPGGGSYQT